MSEMNAAQSSYNSEFAADENDLNGKAATAEGVRDQAISDGSKPVMQHCTMPRMPARIRRTRQGLLLTPRNRRSSPGSAVGITSG